MRSEIVVVGAGPAGLQAALSAAEAGAEVTLVDNYRQAGGQYYRQPAPEFGDIEPLDHQAEGRRLWQQAAQAGLKLLTETTVWGAFEGHQLALDGPNGPDTLQAQALILATGTYERVAAFPGWTLPGVMTTGAAQTLLKEQRIVPGERVVVAGTGPLQLVTAAALVRAGVRVVAVIEGSPVMRRMWRRPFRHMAALWNQGERLAEGLSSWLTLKRAAVPIHIGWGVTTAHGPEQLTAVTIAQLNDRWRPLPYTSRTLSCDTLCYGYGFTPATELARLLGAELHWRPEQGGFVPIRDERMQSSVPGLFIVGDGAGVGGAGLARLEGRVAGLSAAAQVMGKAVDAALPSLAAEQRFQRFYGDLFTPGPGLDELARPDTIICRCEEVTLADIRAVIEQGADTLMAVKQLTRCGMGNCQGRICGPLAAAQLARQTDQAPAQIGQFSVRPPIFPLPMPTAEAVDLADLPTIPDEHR